MGTTRHRRRNIIDRASAAAAAEWILDRRTACDDEDLWRFPGVDDLLGVVEFVERYQSAADEDLRNDAIAALGILNFLSDHVDRLKMVAIRLAREGPRRPDGRRRDAWKAMTWRDLAPPLGVDSYQAAEQVFLRLCARFEGKDGTRDESAGRAIRRRPPPRPPRPAPPVAVVDDAATVEVRAALGQLLALKESLPDGLADDLLELRREATPRRAELTAGELRNALRVITNEMRNGQWPAAVAAALARLVAALG